MDLKVNGRRCRSDAARTPPLVFSFDGCNVQFMFGESFFSLTFRTELLPEFAIQALRPS